MSSDEESRRNVKSYFMLRTLCWSKVYRLSFLTLCLKNVPELSIMLGQAVEYAWSPYCVNKGALLDLETSVYVFVGGFGHGEFRSFVQQY